MPALHHQTIIITLRIAKLAPTHTNAITWPSSRVRRSVARSRARPVIIAPTRKPIQNNRLGPRSNQTILLHNTAHTLPRASWMVPLFRTSLAGAGTLECSLRYGQNRQYGAGSKTVLLFGSDASNPMGRWEDSRREHGYSSGNMQNVWCRSRRKR